MCTDWIGGGYEKTNVHTSRQQRGRNNEEGDLNDVNCETAAIIVGKYSACKSYYFACTMLVLISIRAA